MGRKTPNRAQQTTTGIDAEFERRKAESEKRKVDLESGYSDAKKRSEGLFNDAYGRYTGLLDKSIPETRGRWSEFARTGGIGEADRARMRGGGVYDEYAKTGGWSPERVSLFRNRIAGQTPGFYGSLKNELERNKNVQGGYSPGFTEQNALLARESAHGAQQAVESGELGLQDQISSGRQWGAEGMTSSEGRLQDILGRNTIAGLGGMGDSDRLSLQGIEGIRGLRTDTPIDMQWIDRILTHEQLDAETRSRLLAIRAGMANDPGWWQKWGRDVFGGAAGVIGGL